MKVLTQKAGTVQVPNNSLDTWVFQIRTRGSQRHTRGILKRLTYSVSGFNYVLLKILCQSGKKTPPLFLCGFLQKSIIVC